MITSYLKFLTEDSSNHSEIFMQACESGNYKVVDNFLKKDSLDRETIQQGYKRACEKYKFYVEASEEGKVYADLIRVFFMHRNKLDISAHMSALIDADQQYLMFRILDDIYQLYLDGVKLDVRKLMFACIKAYDIDKAINIRQREGIEYIRNANDIIPCLEAFEGLVIDSKEERKRKYTSEMKLVLKDFFDRYESIKRELIDLGASKIVVIVETVVNTHDELWMIMYQIVTDEDLKELLSEIKNEINPVYHEYFFDPRHLQKAQAKLDGYGDEDDLLDIF